MTFSKFAYNRQVLRALAGEKTADITGTAGRIGQGLASGARSFMGGVKTIAKPVNWAWQKSMKANGPIAGTIGLGLGAMGVAALGSHAINSTRAAYNGFKPEVQAYTQQPQY